MFIAYMDGSIIGYCIISRYREHVKQYFGIVNILYVSPSYRGTEAGRGLIKAATEWFDTNDCSMSYANSTSIIGRDKIFENMTKKFGYESFGSVMMRKKTK